MEKLESLTGGITSCLASDKDATICTVNIEVDLYRLQCSRSTTKEGSAWRNVQNSTPSETSDRMNVQQRIPFETTDWKKTPRSAICPVRQNITYVFKPQTHIAVSTKARNMYIFLATSVFTSYLSWSLHNFQLRISQSKSMQSPSFRFPSQTLVSRRVV